MNTPQQPLQGKNNQAKTPFRLPTLGDKQRKILLLVFGVLSLLLIASLFFTPFCRYSLLENGFPSGEETQPISPSHIRIGDTINTVSMALFVVVLVAFAAAMLHLGLGLRRYSDSSAFAATVQRNALTSFIGTGLYYVSGVLYAIVRNESENRRADYLAGSMIPFVLATVLLLVVFFFARVYSSDYAADTKKDVSARRSQTLRRLELWLYSLLTSGLALFAALGEILHVTFTLPANMEDITINGFEALTHHAEMGEAYQSVAFLVFTILLVTVSMIVATTACLFSRSRLFYKLALNTLIIGATLAFGIGIFGKYYEIAQAVNEEALSSWITAETGLVGVVELEYTVKSGAIFFFLPAMAVVILAIVRRPYSKALAAEAVASAPLSGAATESATATRGENGEGVAAPMPEERPAQETGAVTQDPCPAFTELDGKAPFFARTTASLKEDADTPMSLPALVQHVVSYARDSRLHLFYTPEDIATFIAGLGATRLTILQGMSGTGKTSLPKIFTEALYGNCDIIEVESSWRDKNELLGYYNEFSRTYTPKKFTQALYKAALNPERLTFIVLDEMNLSRIEYYFSDFLSLMENEEDKREIKLLNVGLYRAENGRRVSYQGLTDGHTLKVPANVWFIGTANRDESTFEISDKVYDRAHTMNFNKRAPKAAAAGEPLPRRFLAADRLAELLAEARQNPVMDPDTDPTVKAVEELLAPYNISFGNRIANQIAAFVSVYCACFAPSEQIKQEALERILLSKVVCKLEFKSLENKELLAAEFRRRGLNRCSDFILRLSED